MNIDLKQTFALLILSWMAAVAGCTSIPQLSSTEPATAIRCRMHETADPRNGAKEIHTSYILGDPAGGDHDLFFATLTDPDGILLVKPQHRHFFMSGLCGGYTTFSSFSLQTLNLAREGEWLKAGINSFASLFLCLLAVWLGHILALSLNRITK